MQMHMHDALAYQQLANLLHHAAHFLAMLACIALALALLWLGSGSTMPFHFYVVQLPLVNMAQSKRAHLWTTSLNLQASCGELSAPARTNAAETCISRRTKHS